MLVNPHSKTVLLAAVRGRRLLMLWRGWGRVRRGPFALVQHGIGPDGDDCPVCREVHAGICNATGPDARTEKESAR